MDDYYMSVFFKDDIKSAQCVLRIILDKPDLKVESIKTQEELFSVAGGRAILDVMAIDGAGTLYDIEVQRSGDGADPLRARYYSSALDTGMMPAGADYDELHEKYVIFITETDVLHGGLPIYHIERTVAETGSIFGDREHIVYVNSACRNAETAFGRLMQDFFCKRAEDMNYEELRTRTKELKESKEGCERMSDVIREMVEKGMEKGMKTAKADAAGKMIDKGFDLEVISECFDLSVDEVKAFTKDQRK